VVDSDWRVQVRTRLPWERIGVWSLGFSGIFLLATNGGGYWPTAWGWTSVILLWLIALALIFVRTVEFGRLEILQLAALAGLLVWVLLSALWSSSPTFPFKEGERLLVYVCAVALLMLVVRSGSEKALFGGIWAAIGLVCSYALLTHLLPDQYGRSSELRLERPIGYWNALGLFAAIGLMLALGLVAHARTAFVRAPAGASSVVLAATLYFTFSRGAWWALALGLLSALATTPRRLRLVTAALVIAPWSAACIWLASREDSLSTPGSSISNAGDAGRRLTVLILALAFAAASAALVFGFLERRVQAPLALRRTFAVVLTVLVVGTIVGTFVRYGSPDELVRRGYAALSAAPRPANPAESPSRTNLSERLFTLNSYGRVQ
jgi:hypothetical protein